MSNQAFVIADVFTEKRFGGNQLAVFTDARGLDQETMQNIAREMHYSETTFLFPPEQGGDYRVKIFTPESELPFAGHPIVGTANVIVATGLKPMSEPLTLIRLETGVGLIEVEIQTAGGRAGHTVMTQPLPEVRGQNTEIAALAKSLRLDAADIESTGLPVEILYNGIPVMIVPVASLAALQRIKLDSGALEEICNQVGAVTVLVFTREAVQPAGTVHCRVFVPVAGIPEDAATGSANGPLGVYLVRHRAVAVDPTTRILSEQGFEMNRPSLLHIEVDVDTGSNNVTAVRVGGGVVITGKGEIILS